MVGGLTLLTILRAMSGGLTLPPLGLKSPLKSSSLFVSFDAFILGLTPLRKPLLPDEHPTLRLLGQTSLMPTQQQFCVCLSDGLPPVG